MYQFAFDVIPKANFGGWTLYGIGGVGVKSHKSPAAGAGRTNRTPIVQPLSFVPPTTNSADDFEFCGLESNACYRFATDNWRTKFSWNFGAGTDFHIGSQDMFVEWRFNPISTHGAWTWYMPISLG